LEGDEFQQAMIQLCLTAAAHCFSTFDSVKSAIEGLKTVDFDAFLGDWSLPDGTGCEVIRWIRQNKGWSMALLVLSGQDDEATAVEALQAGADDFVIKPPKRRELLGRLRAATRRSSSSGLEVLHMGTCEIEISRNALSIDGAIQILTQKEFELAVCTFQSPAKLLCRDYLLNKVWGLHVSPETRTVNTHITRLRKKLFLISRRPYKEPWKPDDVAQELEKGMETQFDPTVAHAVLRLYLQGSCDAIIHAAQHIG
jgi:DNA-binding response OmpR family regulator